MRLKFCLIFIVLGIFPAYGNKMDDSRYLMRLRAECKSRLFTEEEMARINSFAEQNDFGFARSEARKLIECQAPLLRRQQLDRDYEQWKVDHKNEIDARHKAEADARIAQNAHFKLHPECPNSLSRYQVFSKTMQDGGSLVSMKLLADAGDVAGSCTAVTKLEQEMEEIRSLSLACYQSIADDVVGDLAGSKKEALARAASIHEFQERKVQLEDAVGCRR